MNTAEKIEMIESGKARLDKKECFGKYNVKTEGAVTLTTEQAALIRAEFTPEGKIFFDRLYSALHLDLFGKVCRPIKLRKGLEK